MIRSAIPRAARQLRAAHTMPDIKVARGQGIPGLFSPRGLEIAWFDYQHHLLTQLNLAIEKFPELGEIRGLGNFATALTQSEDPEFRPLAATAAQAYTNEFFFKSINPAGSKNPHPVLGPGEFKNAPAPALDLFAPMYNLPRMPEGTDELSEEDFASVQSQDFHTFSFLTRSSDLGKLANFKELAITRGDLQMGNGAVWLVKHGDQGSLMNTYGWGTPLTHQTAEGYEALTSTSAQLSVTPVLAINLWEHVYLYDYGVAGKRRFLENVFDCIDWAVVDDRLAPM